MNVRDTIRELLIELPETRDNDNLLIAKTLEKLYGTSDMNKIASFTKVSITESITRCRRKLQETNPMLTSTNAVRIGRKKREKEVREWARKTI